MVKIIHEGKTKKQFHRFVCPTCDCDYVCDDEELEELSTDNYYAIVSYCPRCGECMPLENEIAVITIPKNSDTDTYFKQFFSAE